MTDLAIVYSTLANLGQKPTLNPILRVTDYKGKTYKSLNCLPKNNFPEGQAVEAAKENPCQAKSVLDPKITYLLNNILSDNQARTPAFGPRSLLDIPGISVAVKTGTTNNLRDNWTIGYTPDILVATWVGNNDNSPMSHIASGLTGASSIWNKIIKTLLTKQENTPFPRPEGIVEVDICPHTATLPCQGCPIKKELFVNGTQPSHHCQLKKEKEPEEEREKILGVQTGPNHPKPRQRKPKPPKKPTITRKKISR
jgi:membrane carboxypeptidase/penicillin-binding protein